jgi:hypothetical protein
MAKRLSNTLKILVGSSGSPQTWTDSIGNVIDFNGPAFSNERVDVTDGDSPGGAKEYLSGRQDPGPLSFNIHADHDRTQHTRLFADATNDPPTVRDYRLQPSSIGGDYYEGPAFVASLAPSGSSRDTPYTIAAALQPSAFWSIESSLT